MHLGLAVDKGLVAHAVRDQVGHSDYLEPVLGREYLQIGHAGHGAVVLHDLTDHSGGGKAGQTGQVHRTLGLAGAHQHAAPAGPEGKDVTGAHQILGAGIRVHRRADGVRAVMGADTGGDALGGLDGHGEGGLKGRLVFAHHGGQAQAIHLVRNKAEADETPAMGGHEVDGLGGHHLGGHGEVAFVLTVLVIHQDDHLTVANILNGLGYAGHGHDVFSPAAAWSNRARLRRRRRLGPIGIVRTVARLYGCPTGPPRVLRPR